MCCSAAINVRIPERMGGTRFILVPGLVGKARLRGICGVVAGENVRRVGAIRAIGITRRGEVVL